MGLYIIIGVVILLLIIFLIILNNYLKVKDLNSNIDASVLNIQDVLTKKKDTINSVIEIVKDEKVKALFEKYNENDNIFVKDTLLFDISWNINKLLLDKDNDKKKKKRKSKKDEKIDDFEKEIASLDESLEGLKDYYNANAIKYNELINKKPLKLLYKILKLTEKETFEYSKLSEYEILKN